MKYVISFDGMWKVSEEWLASIPEECIVDSYDGIAADRYCIATDEQIEFNLNHPSLDTYHAFYMIDNTADEKNAKIKEYRKQYYKSIADPLFIIYMHYKYTNQEEKAEAALEEWLAAIETVKEKYPYVTDDEENTTESEDSTNSTDTEDETDTTEDSTETEEDTTEE